MGRPGDRWLAHLEANEDNATSPSKVEAGLIDARFAHRCDKWWNEEADSDVSWHTKAVNNYKSAAATFWAAYEDETTPHIYNALATAAKAASARAAEMEGTSSSTPSSGKGCGCDVCQPARSAPAPTTCHCAACRPRVWHHCAWHSHYHG